MGFYSPVKGIRKRYHFSMEGMQRVIFLPILVYKRVSGWTSGLSLSVLNVF